MDVGHAIRRGRNGAASRGYHIEIRHMGRCQSVPAFALDSRQIPKGFRKQGGNARTGRWVCRPVAFRNQKSESQNPTQNPSNTPTPTSPNPNPPNSLPPHLLAPSVNTPPAYPVELPLPLLPPASLIPVGPGPKPDMINPPSPGVSVFVLAAARAG